MNILKTCLSVMGVLLVVYSQAATVSGNCARDTAIAVSGKGRRQVAFQLADYRFTDTSGLASYRDTVVMALNLLSKVFSSRAFEDSLNHYMFPCSNGKARPCVAYPQLKARKCDSISGLIPGATVYHDLTADSLVQLAITIKTPVKKSRTIGFSNGCVYHITTYDWWMKSRKDVIESYAVHLAHEYAHVVGYVHSKQHPKAEDVAYRIGGIVRNMLQQKEQAL